MDTSASNSLARLRTALQPTSTSIKEFVLTKTKLNGKPFTLKNREYQTLILDLCSNPDIDLVIQKPSQIGASEVVYRVDLAWAYMFPGFSSAIIFPTKAMSNEVMATRIASIINESASLTSILSSTVDSSSVKMFTNNSIMYALGASVGSKSTVINRPIRTIIADELARCDIGVITSLASRQKAQEHESTIYFSTPLLEEADIDLEIQKCGTVYEQILKCSRCGHYFFPDYFQHVKIPGYSDDLKLITYQLIEDKKLDIELAYLQCPKCGKATTHEFRDTEWVDTSDYPKRPKIGVKLSAFCAPRIMHPAKMLRHWLIYDDKTEFVQQVLGLPATKKETAMDITQISFVNEEPGVVNVWGLDLGKICHFGIASVTPDRTYTHYVEMIPLKDLTHRLKELLSRWVCMAGVVDFMPYSDISTKLVNELQNTWAAMYTDPVNPIPEMFKLKIREDEAFGNVKFININKTLTIDTYVDSLMNGAFVFRDSEYKAQIRQHHEAMRRVKVYGKGAPNVVDGNHYRYQWVKPHGSKTIDHLFHLGIYLFTAARLVSRAAGSSLPLTNLVTSFKSKAEL